MSAGNSIFAAGIVASLLAASACEGPKGTAEIVYADAVTYAPLAPLEATTVQGALEEIPRKFFPFIGGEIAGTLSSTSTLDAPLQRARFVVVACELNNTPLCGGLSCGANGATCEGTCGQPGGCTAVCPQGMTAIGGGRVRPGVPVRLDLLGRFDRGPVRHAVTRDPLHPARLAHGPTRRADDDRRLAVVSAPALGPRVGC